MNIKTIILPVAFAFSTAAFAQSSGISEENLLTLDKDGSGSVSLEEFEAFTEFAFGAMDIDKNGALSKAEVDAHAPDGAFARADSDGNGSISAAEFKTRMDANFKSADLDGDGQLN
jgi:Ca2+-binding EF-hand superfamily protein